MIRLNKKFITDKFVEEFKKLIGKTYYVLDKIEIKDVPFEVEKVVEITITEDAGWEYGLYLLKTNKESFYISTDIQLFSTNTYEVYIIIEGRKSEKNKFENRNTYWDKKVILYDNKEYAIKDAKSKNERSKDKWLKEHNITKTIENFNKLLEEK